MQVFYFNLAVKGWTNLAQIFWKQVQFMGPVTIKNFKLKNIGETTQLTRILFLIKIWVCDQCCFLKNSSGEYHN